jgi:tRNA-dihydrouridine synthase B
MIGRAASSNPWIFRQIEQYLATGTLRTARRAPALRDHAHGYYKMLCDRDAPDAVGKMKQFATYFTHGVRNGSKLRVEIYRATEASKSWIRWMRSLNASWKRSSRLIAR